MKYNVMIIYIKFWCLFLFGSLCVASDGLNRGVQQNSCSLFGSLCVANEGVDRGVQQSSCSCLVAYVLLM